MLTSAFELGEKLNNQLVSYYLHKPLWEKYNYPNLNLNFNNWEKIKYLNENGDGFSDEIEKVPNNKGGLYLFFVKCEIITGITEYPFYIGRAQLTEHQNLKKRVKEYFQKFSRSDERPKITKMFNYWSKELHLAYFTLDDNDDVIELEKQLINYLLFPMNDEIPDKVIKQAIKAF